MSSDKSSVGPNDNTGYEDARSGGVLEKFEWRDIPLDQITISEFCRRESYDDLDSLAKSIAKDGLLEPVGVTENSEGHFTLIFGSRRYKVHKQLGLRTIRCKVVSATPAKAAELSFAENYARANVHPIEQARKLKLMMKRFGYKVGELAEKIGWPQSMVSERIAVAQLPEDVLEKVGTLPESPFKFTHALALSKLWDEKRTNHELEVRELQNKTIEHKLSSTELKKLVWLFKDGGFDLLPDDLRTYLLKSKAMTAGMARLYLKPGDAIYGQDQKSQQMRQAAERLSKDEREHFIAKALKAEWSHDRARGKLLEMLEQRLNAGDDKGADPKSGVQKLISDISVFHKQLNASCEEIEHLAESHPERLGALWNAIRQLQKQLRPMETLVRGAVTNQSTIY